MALISNRLSGIAEQFARASSVKEAARLRRLCTRKEWDLILEEAKIIHLERSVTFSYSSIGRAGRC